MKIRRIACVLTVLFIASCSFASYLNFAGAHPCNSELKFVAGPPAPWPIEYEAKDPDKIRSVAVYKDINPDPNTIELEHKGTVTFDPPYSDTASITIPRDVVLDVTGDTYVFIMDNQTPPITELHRIKGGAADEITKEYVCGGILVPVDKFGLLAPYISVVLSIVVVVVAATIYVKHVEPRKENR